MTPSTESKVVCQTCGGPVACDYDIRRVIWRQPIDPTTGEGAAMAVCDLDYDDIDQCEVICVNSNGEHDPGVVLDDEADDLETFKVRQPARYVLVLTDRGQGALMALNDARHVCDMQKLLKHIATSTVITRGPDVVEATEVIPIDLQYAYHCAEESKYLKIVVEEGD